MSNVNDFLPFCPTDTGTNLIEQPAWISSTDRTGGNVPGVAHSAVVNKALRQGTYVAGQLAQAVSDITMTDVLDNATPAQFLAQIKATIARIPRVVDILSTGSGSYNLKYVFFCSGNNATTGATYTHNSQTYTVINTITAQNRVMLSGPVAPLTSGTLTRASGTGDSTILFYAVRAPLELHVRMVGGGGGGGGAGGAPSPSANDGSPGTATTFGSSLLTCNPGGGGIITNLVSGLGGSATISSGAIGIAITGSTGGGSSQTSTTGQTFGLGPSGGSSPFGGQGGSQGFGVVSSAGSANSGSGGGGAGSVNGGGQNSGPGGGSGGYIEAQILSPSTFGAFSYVIGTGGSGGTGNGGGNPAGGAGGSGVIIVESFYQ